MLRPRNDAEILFRLRQHVNRLQRRQRNFFQFPFGKVNFVDGLSFLYQFQDIYIDRVYEFSTSQKNPLILDCGGNVGLSVIWFKHKYPQSRIHVFEADPDIAQTLTKNIQSLQLENVAITTAAVWTNNGQVNFANDGADGGCISEKATRQVAAVRLADCITEPVDLLKLDIEGAEFDVIQDLITSGKIQQVQRIICEIHNRDASCKQFAEVLTGLSQAGFNLSISQAHNAPDLSGAIHPTPFAHLTDAKFLLQFYAWQV